MLRSMSRIPFLRTGVNGLAGWSVVVAFVLIGIALMTTVWTTRASVLAASTALRGGQALAIEHAVRADLTQLDDTPSSEDLATVLATHGAEGLRYLALFDRTGATIASAGMEQGHLGGDQDREALPTARHVRAVGDRLRMTVRLFGGPMRRAMLSRRSAVARAVLEFEPVQANSLRASATHSLGIGAIATASLLAVAIVLLRRESRRHANERERERQQRLASLGEMSAVLAHEIRNPLASLKGNAQLLAQMLPGGDKPRAKADRVVEEAVRLEKLTQDLLRFVRTSELHRIDTDPGALVRDALASWHSETAGNADPSKSLSTGAAEVSIDTAAAPRAWSLDADRVREVVLNLVDNASAAGPPVRITVAAVDRRLRIDVSDCGPGVPAIDRERIFEPFVTSKTSGTGLGLAVARRIVEAHGGTLHVVDSPHHTPGATFRIEIPPG